MDTEVVRLELEVLAMEVLVWELELELDIECLAAADNLFNNKKQRKTKETIDFYIQQRKTLVLFHTFFLNRVRDESVVLHLEIPHQQAPSPCQVGIAPTIPTWFGQCPLLMGNQEMRT